MNTNTKTDLFIGPNQRYYYGGSGCPARVIVDRIVTETRDIPLTMEGVTNPTNTYRTTWVYFYRFPYYCEQRADLNSFRLNAQKGCQTKLQNVRQDSPLDERSRAYFQDLQADLENLLSGKKGSIHDFRSSQNVRVSVAYLKEMAEGKKNTTLTNAWSLFESLFPLSISHSSHDGTQLFLYPDREEACLIANDNRLKKLGFIIVGIEDNPEY